MRNRDIAKAVRRAVVYSRFSPRPKQYDAAGNEIPCDSGDNQEGDCRAHCGRREYEIIGAFRDEFVSGDAELEKREGLTQAFALLGRGVVLVVFRPQRLSRDAWLRELLRRRVEAVGATIEYVEGDMEGDTIEAKLARDVLAAVDEYQKKLGAMLTSWGMKRNQANGRRQSDRLPYGWKDDVAGPRTDKGRCVRMIPDEAEQAIVERIVAMAVAGAGSMKIKRTLEAEGLSCRGKPTWNRLTIENIIRRGLTANQGRTPGVVISLS